MSRSRSGSRASRSSVGPTTDPVPPVRGGPTRAAHVSGRGPPPPPLQGLGAPSIERDGAPGQSGKQPTRTLHHLEAARCPERRAHLPGCEGAGLASMRDIGRSDAVECVVAAGMRHGRHPPPSCHPRPPRRHARPDRARRRAEGAAAPPAPRRAAHVAARPRSGGTACLIVRHLCNHISDHHHHRLHSWGNFSEKTPSPPGADVSPQPLDRLTLP